MNNIKLIIILFIITGTSVFAQKTITGKVTDLSNFPIAGANVIVKGKSQGTTTNFEGLYTIDNLKPEDVLVFSYLGFITVEKKIAENSIINIFLKEDHVSLGEVVVVGYGSVRKKDLTGAVATIKAEDLTVTPTSNFDQALAGRAAGVQVTSSDGTPGAPVNIVIRGGNSITGDNSPLYVIDGIPLEDFDPSSINTSDIKSFDILKDASATAIYGSRGANGVVVINTKDGRTDGKTTVKIRSSIGVQIIPNRLDVLGPYEYVKYQEALSLARDNYSPGENTLIFKSNWLDPEIYRDAEGTDWQDKIFQTAYIKNNTVAIGGGNKKTSFYFSGNYVDQEGTLITTSFKKYNSRLKIVHNITDHFKFDAQLSYNIIQREGLQVSGNSRTSVIRDAISFRPVNPVNFSADFSENELDQDPWLYSPVKTLENTLRSSDDDVISGSLGLTYKFLNKFTLNVKGSYWSTIRESSVFYKAETQEATRSNRGINGLISDRRYNTLSTSNTLIYKDRFGKHSYNALLGFEAQYRNYSSSDLRNTNLPTDQFGINNLGIATGATIATTFVSESALSSYFGRINYSYDNRYLATVNFRADGSSKFRKENRWGYFPSLSFAWRVSNEKFLSKSTLFTDLKFRAGWGLTGNNRIGDFDAYNLFSVNNSSGYVLGEDQSFSPGAYQTRLAVPDLRWETTSQTNLGLDLELSKKLNFTLDYYYKQTKDLLLNANMSPSTGFNTVQQNVGQVDNQGFEFSVNSKNIETKNFSWSSDFNISFNRSKVIKLNSGQNEILTDPQWDLQFMQNEFQYTTRVGQPVGMIYGLQFDGLYQLDDFIVNNGSYELKDGIPSYSTVMRPGMVKFKDQLTVDTNGDGVPDAADGVINVDDRSIIGNPHPKHIGGFMNKFKFKNFDFQFLLQWAYDFDILNGNKSEFGSIYQYSRNGFPSLAEFWRPDNSDTTIGGVRFDNVNLVVPFGNKLDDRHVDDGSYLRLKTIVLGYNLPTHVTEKLNIRQCRFFISAQNIFTWTNYEGYNPDVSVGRFGALTPALDYSAYPQSLTVSGGLELTF